MTHNPDDLQMILAGNADGSTGTLVDCLLAGGENFTTLVTAVKAADLIGTLSGGNSRPGLRV